MILDTVTSIAPPAPVAVPAAPVKSARTSNVELEFPPEEIAQDFGPILEVLRGAGAGVRVIVTGGADGPQAIATYMSHRKRHDRFVIHFSTERMLAWLGSEMFCATEPANITSRDFLSALEDRIDAFFHGAERMAGGRSDV